MKNSKFSNFLILLGVTSSAGLMFMAGCGGGGGGGSSATQSTLDTESIQKLAQHLVEEGNCVAVSGVNAAALRSTTLTNSTSPVQQKAILRSYPIDSTTYGLISGSLRKHGEHNNGTTSLSYDYTNYTNPVGDLKVAVSGSASVIDHGTPGDYGPIMSHKTIDTKGDIDVIKSSYNRKSSGNYKFRMSGYTQTYAKSLGPDSLKITSASITNSDSGDESQISQLTANGYINPTVVALTNLKTTYTNSTTGTLTVKSDSLTINRDSVEIPSSISGTLDLTATDGTKAEAVINETGSIKIYTVKGSDKSLVSEVDCSSLVH